jgi:hypothetical protein
MIAAAMAASAPFPLTALDPVHNKHHDRRQDRPDHYPRQEERKMQDARLYRVHEGRSKHKHSERDQPQ